MFVGDKRKPMTTAKSKAEELVIKYGKKIANEICDLMLDEINLHYRQERIDYWLDVKLEAKKVVIKEAKNI